MSGGTPELKSKLFKSFDDETHQYMVYQYVEGEPKWWIDDDFLLAGWVEHTKFSFFNGYQLITYRRSL